MTEEELIEIEARAAAATPGPWEYDGMHNEIQCSQSADSYWLIVSESRSAPDQAQKQTNSFFDANYAFIAAARSDVPALVAEVRRLRAELAKYADIEPGIYTEQWKWVEPSGTTAQRGKWKRTVVWCVPA